MNNLNELSNLFSPFYSDPTYWGPYDLIYEESPHSDDITEPRESFDSVQRAYQVSVPTIIVSDEQPPPPATQITAKRKPAIDIERSAKRAKISYLALDNRKLNRLCYEKDVMIMLYSNKLFELKEKLGCAESENIKFLQQQTHTLEQLKFSNENMGRLKSDFEDLVVKYNAVLEGNTVLSNDLNAARVENKTLHSTCEKITDERDRLQREQDILKCEHKVTLEECDELNRKIKYLEMERVELISRYERAMDESQLVDKGLKSLWNLLDTFPESMQKWSRK